MATASLGLTLAMILILVGARLDGLPHASVATVFAMLPAVMLAAITACVCGIIALTQILRSAGRLSGFWMAIASISLSLMMLLFAGLGFIGLLVFSWSRTGAQGEAMPGP